MMITGKQLKALSKICSKDSARGAITCIAVRPQGDVSATDGHRLVSLEHKLDIAETLYLDAQDTKRIAASDIVQIQATQGILVTPKNGNPYIIPYVTDVGDFPQISQVVPHMPCDAKAAQTMSETLSELELDTLTLSSIGDAVGKAQMAVRNCLTDIPSRITSHNKPHGVTPVLNGKLLSEALGVIATFQTKDSMLATEIRTHGTLAPIEISFTIEGISGYCLVSPIRADNAARKKMQFRPLPNNHVGNVG